MGRTQMHWYAATENGGWEWPIDVTKPATWSRQTYGYPSPSAIWGRLNVINDVRKAKGLLPYTRAMVYTKVDGRVISRVG